MRPLPRVSVVVPTYRHEAHVEEALRSVAAQEGVELELVVVDDASPDGTLGRVEALLASPAFRDRFEGGTRLERHRENQGAHAALNRGLGQARGEYLAILNSDDRYAPHRLRQLVDALVDAEAGLAFSRVSFLDAASRPVQAGPEVFRLRQHQDAVDRYPSVGFACLAGNAAISSGNLVFTRELLEAVGPFQELRLCHDWDFVLRAVLCSEPVFVRQPLYEYRLHGDNSFRSLDDRAVSETQQVLGRFFARGRGADIRNPLAPTEAHWPGVFDYQVQRLGFTAHR